jgi:hypothetical protein
MEPIQDLAARLCEAKLVTAEDLSALRKALWMKPELYDSDLRHLISINQALAAPDPAFADLFGEAVVHFLLRQEEPKYFLKETMVDWVQSRLVHEGRIDSFASLEALVRVLEQAENSPARFKQWALAEIERSVLTGQGPTRLGGNISPGVVDSDDARFLRRTLFASGGAGALHVTSEEAEALFRIKDITKDAINAPEWDALFVQGCANYLMAHVGRAVLTEDDMTRLERVMDDNKPHLGRFLLRMNDMGNLSRSLGWAISGDEDRDIDAEVIAAKALTPSEIAWLKQKIVEDGRTDRYEKALLTFLSDEAAGLPPALELLRQAS